MSDKAKHFWPCVPRGHNATGGPGGHAACPRTTVTSFKGYGMGSCSYFDQGVSIENAMAIQAPQASGVQFNDLLTVFLNGAGGIESVINGTGAAVSPSNGGPSDVVSYS